MELKQFITQTLNDIIDGIADAQIHAIEKQAVINPTFQSDKVTNTYFVKSSESGYSGFAIQEIEFDIAVTVTNEDKSKGGIGVLSAVLNVGVQGEESLSSNEISRVKFSVPIVLPLDQTEFIKKGLL